MEMEKYCIMKSMVKEVLSTMHNKKEEIKWYFKNFRNRLPLR